MPKPSEKIVEFKEPKKHASLNIYQRMNLVMKDVERINKDGINAHQKYKFVSHDKVMGVLHKPLADHGIMVTPTVKEVRQDGNRTTVFMEIKFVNIDNSDDYIMVHYPGYGIDTQDKGIGKAVSYAFKCCLLKIFCLEAGEDVERDNIEYVPSQLKEENINKLFKDALPENIKLEEILKYVSFCAKKYNKEDDAIKKSALSRMGSFLTAYKSWAEVESPQ